MDTFVFLGTVALFDLFVAMLIRRDIMTYGPDRTPLTERVTNAAIPLSIVASVVGIFHLSGVV
jgi:hypothetical protein